MNFDSKSSECETIYIQASYLILTKSEVQTLQTLLRNQFNSKVEFFGHENICNFMKKHNFEN